MTYIKTIKLRKVSRLTISCLGLYALNLILKLLSILKGNKVNLGNNLSSISIKRVERNNSKPTIDWGESNTYKKELLKKGVKLYDNKTKEGTKWYIYYTDKDFYRYAWHKGKCKIPNKSVYKFVPTRGVKGNKEKLTTLLKQDDLAYLTFKKN